MISDKGTPRMIPKGQLSLSMNYPLSVLPTMQIKGMDRREGEAECELEEKTDF